ncbi:hypothetical protein OG291_08820 [Streptomyces halstedii]|uniref:hypothetical protein n=1 Tax=Streptomyces halstedii TaxID=1944 RepID=UPI00386A6AE9|nr:hypothetical protein OG291_08820 [Streptomyces halstedii]
MSTVTWRVPDKLDRRKLQAFTCALGVPPKGRPPSWEHEVQAYFRTQALADTGASRRWDQRFRIAEDAWGIAAAYTHARPASHHPDLRVPPGTACRYLLMLGIAARYRKQGGKFADEVLLDALYDVLEREPNHESVAVFARVDRHNIPSQKMLGRVGFRQVIAGTPERRLGWWLLTVDR